MERDGHRLAYIRRYDISTHTLTWSVTGICAKILPKLYYFNSHAHVERDGIEKPLGVWDFDFNSHAHVERDEFNITVSGLNKISTHTLTWSVTFFSATLNGNKRISTHTLTWSVTTGRLEIIYLW